MYSFKYKKSCFEKKTKKNVICLPYNFTGITMTSKSIGSSSCWTFQQTDWTPPLFAIESHHQVGFGKKNHLSVAGEGKKKGQDYMTCLLQLPAAERIPQNVHLPTHPPTYRPARELYLIRDQVLKCGGRECGEKKSGTRGVYHTARNKESVYTNGCADETRRNKPALPCPPLRFPEGLLGFKKTYSTSSRHFLFARWSPGDAVWIWTVRNLEFITPLRQDARLSAAGLFLSLVRWTRSKVLRSHGRNGPMYLFHIHCAEDILKLVHLLAQPTRYCCKDRTNTRWHVILTKKCSYVTSLLLVSLHSWDRNHHIFLLLPCKLFL